MIQLACQSDVKRVEALYHELLKYLKEKDHPAGVGWQLGVYPTKKTAIEATSAGSLYLLTQQDVLKGCMILDSAQDNAYEQMPWSIASPPEKVLVVHTLCVHPQFQRQGLAEKLLTFAVEHGQANGYQTLRLDTWSKNNAARELYAAFGFSQVGEGPLSPPRLKGQTFSFFEYNI